MYDGSGETATLEDEYAKLTLLTRGGVAALSGDAGVKSGAAAPSSWSSALASGWGSIRAPAAPVRVALEH